MINRGAIILKCKQPFIKWVNAADPVEKDPDITAADVNRDRTVYLVSDADAENYEEWVNLNYKVLFENVLYDWFTDESLWPKNRTKKMFDEWFDVKCYSVLIDTVGGDIYDEQFDSD